MRPLAAVALLVAAGLAVACLVVGWGRVPACAAAVASVSCVGVSMRSTVDMLGVTAALGLLVAGLFALSILWQVRRHRRVFTLLDERASPARLADHAVELVPGLVAP